MLRVVQPAACDWEPPHMSGYPHLPPPPPPQYPLPHAHRQPQQPYHQDPQWHPYPPLPPPPPPRPRRMACRCGASRPPCPMACPPSQRASRLSFNRRRCSARSPLWHRSRRCVGGCGTNPIVRPPLRLSMRGLYGAVSHMYVDPPVSSAQCFATRWPPLCFHSIRSRPARRGTIGPRASGQKDLVPVLKRFRDPPAKHRNFRKNRTFRESV